ncbi:MAG: FAD-dependent monooxygenase [Pseudomonadales bacterium]|nr:FAD-dependent monooxygenase [Pseudomonadales bacterium]
MKVLIAGGGIGGITAALCLAEQDIEVELFEQADVFSAAGAGIQLSPNCTRVLHRLGLEPVLREKGFLPEGTEVRQWRTGAIITESTLGDSAIERFGFPYYHIHRGDLLALLVDAAEDQSKIQLNTGKKIEDFSDDENTVTIKQNGQTVEGDALIGADGIHSTIRAKLWGEEKPTFTGNIAWRALVPATKLPDGLVKPTSTVWWGPGKHFVHYYVRGGEFVNCVCVVEKQGWEIESWTARGEYAELKADFDGWNADIQTLIESADHDSLYKWALYDRPPMKVWGKNRVSLLGDACHPTLPFMAQGAAMAIEDGAVLAACLKQHSDVPQALQNYQRLRQSRTAGVQNGSRRNATIFHMSGMKAWLRNRAAKRASGATLDRLYRYDVYREKITPPIK